MKLFKPTRVAHAHCDLPCGVYDPAQARINAESVVNASKKYQESDDAAFKQRCITIKEDMAEEVKKDLWVCLLYTSPSPRDKRQSRMPSSA